MNARSGYILVFSAMLIVTGMSASFGQEHSAGIIRFVFYNVENLFDTRDDTLTDDNEFLPGGQMHWTDTRYRNKINSIYKVLTAAGEWNPPALVGFCEIENSHVLKSLIYDTWLSKYQYGIVTGESADPRGIRTGIIYRKDIMRLLTIRNIAPQRSEGFRSRMILYTGWELGEDTIHLFLNHWPSRRRGVLAEEKTREAMMSALERSVDSLLKLSEMAKIIIAGDFNCTPDDIEIDSLCKVRGIDNFPDLVDLSAAPAGRGEGTFRFRGKWEMIDQVIVSAGILGQGKGIYTSADLLRIFRPDFIMTKDTGYPGLIPFSTYKGYSYQGGFSDHLPLIIDLKLR